MTAASPHIEKISVIIPAFNAEQTIVRAVNSALSQSLAADEVIVVDDGSTDGTLALLEALPLRVIRQVNRGAAAARNAGVRHSRGSWIAFLDADDQWHHRKLELQFDAIARHPEAALCVTRCQYQPNDAWGFDPTASVGRFRTEVIDHFPRVFGDPHLGTPSVVIRRERFDRCGGFNEELQVAEDVDLWLRAAYESVVLRLDYQLVGLGRSPKGLSSLAGDMTYRSELRVLESFVADHPAFARGHSGVVRRARGRLHTRLASEMLSRGENLAARRELWAAVKQVPMSLRTMYLLLKAHLGTS